MTLAKLIDSAQDLLAEQRKIAKDICEVAVEAIGAMEHDNEFKVIRKLQIIVAFAKKLNR